MKPLPRYVCLKRVKGRAYLYFRRGDVYQRLPDNPSSPAFAQRYAEIMATWETPARRAREGTVGALVLRYQASARWQALTPRTRTTYAAAFDRLAPIRDEAVADIRRRHIRELRDLSGLRPRAADMLVTALSSLFALAVDDEDIETNPAHGIDRLARSRAYRAWSADDQAVMETAIAEARVPEWAARAYMLARYLGARRANVLALTWGSWRGGRIAYKPVKGGTPVDLRVHATLAAWLRPRRGAAGEPIVATDAGRPWDDSAFSHALRAVLDGLGLEDRHLHGLRHTVGSSLAEAGAGDEEIMAVTGHRSVAAVRIYTAQARRRTMADQAMTRLENGKPRPATGKPARPKSSLTR